MKYLLPKARNILTGQTVYTEDLTGGKIALHQRKIADLLAQQLADKMTMRTGGEWRGFVEEYTAK
jgi:hypothetical protein